MRSPCTATESSPHFLQLKKVLRPSAAKDTLFSIKGHWSFFKLSRIIAFQSSFPQDFWQGGQGNSRRKNVVFSINVPGPLDLHRQKMKLDPYFSPYAKINSKCITNLNIRAKKIELSRENRKWVHKISTFKYRFYLKVGFTITSLLKKILYFHYQCNQTGPYRAFLGQTLTLHVLCYIPSPKYLGDSIWYTFPELFYGC